MNRFLKPGFFLAVFLLFSCIVPWGSAFTVSSVDVRPSGFQSAGTPMTVITVIEFPVSGKETFPSSNDLLMSTDLVDPYWVPIVVLDGQETRLEIKAGGEMIVPSWYLSYPSSQELQLMMTLTGKIPSDRHTGDTIVKIQERDAAKNIVSTASVGMPEVPLVSETTQIPPTKKPTSTKIYTPIPTDTPSASMAGAGTGIVALAGAALLVMKRK